VADKVQLHDTGERMVPEYHEGLLIYAEHLVRYQVAQKLVEGKVVLDIASGSGYGTALLAQTAKHAYGFDADAEAVAYATERYGAPNISFETADATSIPLEDNSIDVVTTFETIEHIENYEKFMAEIKRVLKPNGLAIVSTPNDLEFAEGNHFHLHEFVKDELVSLVGRYFRNIEEYYQATWKYVAIDRLEALQAPGPLVRPILNSAPLKQEESLYFYFLCSDAPITDLIEPVSALGEHYSERALILNDQAHEEIVRSQREELSLIKSSRTFHFAQKLASFRSRFRA
jgi:2-polyprenyl-3-methyl-5-hydroxy-6-metoxy-1,4-benzoquinol methylase